MIGWYEFKAAGMENCHGKYVVKDGRDHIAFLQPVVSNYPDDCDYYLSLTLIQKGFYDKDGTGAVRIYTWDDMFKDADDWLKANGYEDAK